MTKPQPGIFEHMLEEMNLDPGQVLFVDDCAPNVEAAMGLGMGGVVMQRNGTSNGTTLPVVREMKDVIKAVKSEV